MDQELLSLAVLFEWPTWDRTASLSTPVALPELTKTTMLRLPNPPFRRGADRLCSVISLLNPGSGFEVIIFLFPFSPTFDMGSCRNLWKTESSVGEMFLNGGAPDLL